jgi:predicted acetyltransferase
MIMRLVRANVSDCEKIWSLQIEAFADLLAKYQDYETSPGNEPKENIQAKLLDEFTFFYFIYLEDEIAGAVRVVDRKNGNRKRIAPIFIMKKFRNRGLAQKTFKEIEKIHGSKNWMLDTILQEAGNCYLYEKLGYKRTGKIEHINERMDIVYYEKN